MGSIIYPLDDLRRWARERHLCPVCRLEHHRTRPLRPRSCGIVVGGECPSFFWTVKCRHHGKHNVHMAI